MFYIEDSYLEDEVRDGFYIPSISKRAFAAELSLLYELDRICSKYKLKYFADWGSLLGAIRHRGFIPWDDDLDVCMHRNDLEKLIEASKTELKNGFEIHSFENNDYSWKFIYNLVNTEKMCFTPDYLKTHYNFPYIAAIDIFVIDNVTNDEEYEEKRRKDVKFILDVADLCTEENIKKPEYIEALKTVEKLCSMTINKNQPVIELKRLLFSTVQNILKEKNNIKTDYVVQMIPWGIYNNVKIDRSYYEENVYVPFENTAISVSKKYYSLFRKHKYGRFWEIKMGVGGHGYPYYNAQKEELGTDMDYVPHYKFDEAQLKRETSAKEGSIKSIACEYSEYLKISYNNILEAVENSGKYSNDEIINVLTENQNNAIQFGTLVEKAKGEGTRTVEALEKYCEHLFLISQLICNGNDAAPAVNNDLRRITDDIIETIESELINRRTVVFLPFKGAYFDTLRPYYDMEFSKTDTDAFIVPLPYFYKEYNGTFKEEAVYDLSKYPSDIEYKDYRDFNIGLLHPDTVYIQNPYDEFNMAISVPNYYYASNIKNMTDELIYVPWFKTSDFDKNNYPQNYNMQFYCTVPGVVLSDTVYLNSEKIRERYIDKLTEFSDEKYRELWESRIKLCPVQNEDKTEKLKKHLCFYVSPSALLEYNDAYFKKIYSCIDIFNKEKDNVDIIWRIEPYELDMVKSGDIKVYERLMNMIEDVNRTENIKADFEMSEDRLTEVCSAFYGDGSHLSKDFVIAGKPVMIMDASVI